MTMYTVKVIVAINFIVAVASPLVIRDQNLDSEDSPLLDDWRPFEVKQLEGLQLMRNKREDIIKFLVDAVDSDIDKCGSPLQLQKDQVTVSVSSLTCIVQALVDSLNQGPGLLRKILDNLLKKRDLTAVSGMAAQLTRSEEQCAMRAIVKQALNVIRAEHGHHQWRNKRMADDDSESNRCAQIENKIEQSMRQAKDKGEIPQA